MRSHVLKLLGAGALVLAGVSSASAISFIDSPTAYCAKVSKDKCVINWGYMAVDASPNYIVELVVLVEDKLVFRANGFFQQSMYVGNEFIREGISVKCGREGTTPLPQPTPDYPLSYGNSYRWTIRARDSANLKSANSGTVVCPPK